MEPYNGDTVVDKVRDHVGESVSCRNWWRPQPYNKLVAESGANSDHLHACGLDLDFESKESRRKAQIFLKKIDRENPWLIMSFGFGAKTIHVGILSPKGRRVWKYDSYKKLEKQKDSSVANIL